MSLANRLSRGLFSLLPLSWPIIIWLGITKQYMHWLTPVLIGLIIVKLIAFLPDNGPLRNVFRAGSFLAILLCVMSTLFQQHGWLLWYPVAINLLMLAFFGHSLLAGTPIIEQLARIRRPTLPDSAIRYTQVVTKVWCVFFVVNGIISAITTCLGNMTWWGIWNGLISYLIMGVLLVGEWLVRQRIAQ